MRVPKTIGVMIQLISMKSISVSARMSSQSRFSKPPWFGYLYPCYWLFVCLFRGYSWCGCTNGDQARPRAKEWDQDFGTPVAQCAETGSGTGVYERKWTNATVQVPCLIYIQSSWCNTMGGGGGVPPPPPGPRLRFQGFRSLRTFYRFIGY